ncbi:MAG: hypothetical protein HND56_08140 [Pseudomonadota bacterium]|nr:hypothetical protein [Pseudomonadota bacterium]QKK05657.1 MAG: hypothetical protein HND56_08140 [Pseudomonadota bacterium]
MQHRHRFLVLLLVLTVFLSMPAMAESPVSCKGEAAAWRNCKDEKDCVTISNPCGWPSDAANKVFAEQAQQCNIIRGAAMGCPAYDAERDGGYTARCIVGKCVAVKDIP